MAGQTKWVYRLLLMVAPYTCNAFQNKKAFHSRANLPLSDSPSFIVNNLERVCWGGGGGVSVDQCQGPIQRMTEPGLYTGRLSQVPYRKGIGPGPGPCTGEGAGALYRDPP